jgi:hypothetical protein
MSFFPVSPLARPLAAAAALAALAYAALRLVPPALARLPGPPADLDLGVVLLFVPLCALILAMLALALRLVAHGGTPEEFPPFARGIAHWQDEED